MVGSTWTDLVALFLIAVLVVSPYGLILLRRAAARGRQGPAAADATTQRVDDAGIERMDVPSATPGSDGHDSDDLSFVVERIGVEAPRLRTDAAAGFVVDLDQASHAHGSPLPIPMAAALLADAARRAEVPIVRLSADGDTTQSFWIGLPTPGDLR